MSILTLRPDEAIDLHLHTYASDGFWDPAELVDKLADDGFRVAAVCDHDTQASVLRAIRQGERRGVHVIPGVEMTVWWGERQWHLLVYGIRPDDERPEAKPFLDLVAEHESRLRRIAKDARQRVEASGRPLLALPKVTQGREMLPVHVLLTMIADHHVPSLKEAAELVTALGGAFNTDSPLAEVVSAAHQADGICLVAHPGRPDLGPAMTEETLDRMLAEVPIDGLEAHYRTYTDDDTARFRQLAADRGLLVSTGSDSHGPGVPVDPRAWQAIWAQELLGRLGVVVEDRASGPVWERGMDPLNAKPEPAKEEVKEPAAAG